MSGLRHIVEDIAWRWRHHRDARAGLREIDSFDPQLAAEIAAEAGVSVSDLRDIVARGAGADRLMERMIAAFGIEGKELEAHAPGLLRDVGLRCSRCQSKGRCAQELEVGTARENAHLFCPNADTFETFA